MSTAPRSADDHSALIHHFVFLTFPEGEVRY